MAEFDAKKALNQIEPTEQLQYYKKRLADVSDEYFKLLDAIEKLKEDYAINEYYQNKIFSMYDEVHVLRKSVSDLQIQILQERENVMKLIVENEKLKTDLALSNRLAHLGVTGVDIDSLWAPTRPELKTLMMRNERVYDTEQKCKITRELVKTIEELNVQVGKIKLKTENISDVYAAEIACLIKDRDLTQKEFNRERDTMKSQIKVLQESIRKMKTFSLGTLSDVASIKAECLLKETAWQKEFNGMLTHLQLCKELMGDRFPRFPESACSAAAAMNLEDATARRSQTEHALKLQLNQKNSLITKYHRKCMDLQKEIETLSSMKSQLKQETMAKVGRLIEKIKFLKKHCEEQKNRRKLDAEGFYNEFHLLKTEVERFKREMAVQSRVLQKKEEKTLLGQNVKTKKY